jgi:hypothetical protein
MQVLFKSRDRDAVRLRNFARQRIRFVFRRMDWLISKATVSLSDINGPRGGLDKRCQVQVQTPDSAPVVVTSIAHDWRGALDLALGRAARAIVRRQQANLAARRLNQRERERERAWSMQAELVPVTVKS